MPHAVTRTVATTRRRIMRGLYGCGRLHRRGLRPAGGGNRQAEDERHDKFEAERLRDDAVRPWLLRPPLQPRRYLAEEPGEEAELDALREHRALQVQAAVNPCERDRERQVRDGQEQHLPSTNP